MEEKIIEKAIRGNRLRNLMNLVMITMVSMSIFGPGFYASEIMSEYQGSSEESEQSQITNEDEAQSQDVLEEVSEDGISSENVESDLPNDEFVSESIEGEQSDVMESEMNSEVVGEENNFSNYKSEFSVVGNIPYDYNVKALSNYASVIDASGINFVTDNVDSTSDKNMYEIDNINYITLNSNDKTNLTYTTNNPAANVNGNAVEYDGYSYNDSTIKDSFTYNNAGYAYTEGTGVQLVDIEFTIDSIKPTTSDPKGTPYLKVITTPSEVKEFRILHQSVDVNFTLRVTISDDQDYSNGGEPLANRDITFIWEDMDALTSITFNKNDLVELVYPMVTSKSTTDLGAAATYYLLDNQINTSEFSSPSGYYDYGGEGSSNVTSNEKYKNERLGLYASGEELTVTDRWNTQTKINNKDRDKVEKAVEDSEYYINPIIKASNASVDNLQNTPGQNFSTVNKLDSNGEMKFEVAQETGWAGLAKTSSNNLYLASPDFAPTVITKELTEQYEDGFATVGEVLTYNINITNPSDKLNAYLVNVRDSLLENMPDYLEWDGMFTLSDGYTGSGDITDGTYFIDQIGPGETATITYSVTVLENVPDDVYEVINVATDNSINPEGVCDSSTPTEDCDGTEIPVAKPVLPIDPQNGDTFITKTVSDENGDGYANGGEVLTYKISVMNDTNAVAHNVEIKDSMLQSLPEYMTYNEDETLNVNNYSGSLTTGDLVVTTINPDDVVVITYSVTLTDDLNDVEYVLNMATDNGLDPIVPIDPEKPEEICPVDSSRDCDSVVVPVQPETVLPIDPENGDTIITKEVTDEDSDGLASEGEILTYTISVTNDTNAVAHNVEIKDSMLEYLPEYVTYNDDVVLNVDDYSGSLTDGDLIVTTIDPGEIVTVSYSVTVSKDLSGVEYILNMATDNGDDPIIPIDPEKPEGVCLEESVRDCDSVIIPVKPITLIEKDVISSAEKYQVGDQVDYQVTISNPTAVPAVNVELNDSLFEETPSYMQFGGNISVEGSEYSIEDDSLILEEVAASESVVVKYSFNIIDEITDESYTNIATDNGDDPIELEICEDKGIDCDDATIEFVLPPTGGGDGNLVDTGSMRIFEVISLTVIGAIVIFVKKQVI